MLWRFHFQILIFIPTIPTSIFYCEWDFLKSLPTNVGPTTNFVNIIHDHSTIRRSKPMPFMESSKNAKLNCFGCCHYYYYYYYHLHAGYLQLCTWNKPSFYSIQCCSCSADTIYGTCNITAHYTCWMFCSCTLVLSEIYIIIIIIIIITTIYKKHSS